MVNLHPRSTGRVGSGEQLYKAERPAWDSAFSSWRSRKQPNKSPKTLKLVTFLNKK